MEAGIMLGTLGLYAIEDWKKRKITAHYLIVIGVVGLCIQFCNEEGFSYSNLGGMVLGAGVMILSRVTGGSIGMGDGLLLLVTGIYLGAERNMALFFTGLLYAAFWSLGLIVLGKGKRKREIPFVPFLLAGYITVLIGGKI